MRYRIKILSIIAALLALLLLGACSKPAPDSPEATASDKTQSKVFGAFESTDLAGNAVTQEIFAGKKLTMVNIWATFCAPCIREMPDLKALSEEYADRDFQIVGIPTDLLDQKGSIDGELLGTAREIIAKTGADYMHILPSDDLMRARLGRVTSVPETVFVDANGNQIGKSYIGSRTKEQWARIIDVLLEQVQ